MKYFIDAALAEWWRRSLPFLIASRQCYLCQQSAQDAFASTDPREYIDRIVEHCAAQVDYLLEDTPLKEAIFRVLLSHGNRPLDASEISTILTEHWAAATSQRNTSPDVIERLLRHSESYCIAPATELDIEGWRYPKSSKPPTWEPGGFPEPEQIPTNQPSTNKPPALPHPGNPYDSTSRRSPRQAASPELGERYEKLLFWLSAIGEGTRPTFTQACLKLGVVEDGRFVGQVLRRLRLLGHVELSDDGGRWEISPAALVRIASEPDKVFLAGQRVPSSLKEYGHDAIPTTQPYHLGPPRVGLTTQGSRDVAPEARNTAAMLADLLPTLAEWKETLADLHGLVTSQFEVEKWDGHAFRPSDSLYQRYGRYHGESGMYRLSRSSDNPPYERTLFFDEPNQRWLRGDWYGLRFLANSDLGDQEAVHDSSENALLIPEAQRWPLLHERALVLSSGLLPRNADNLNWLLYNAVPLDLAQTLCLKLNVKLRQENKDA